MLYIVWCINKYFYTCKHSYSYFTSSLMSLFFPLAVGFTITSQEYYLCSKKLIWCVCLKLLITKYHNWKKMKTSTWYDTRTVSHLIFYPLNSPTAMAFVRSSFGPYTYMNFVSLFCALMRICTVAFPYHRNPDLWAVCRI